MVVTVEPGFYVVPAILEDNDLRTRFSALVDFERAASWAGFGGIRIEDDVVVTTTPRSSLPPSPRIQTPSARRSAADHQRR